MVPYWRPSYLYLAFAVFGIQALFVDNGVKDSVATEDPAAAVAAGDANDVQTILDARFLDLGKLKGNQGHTSRRHPCGSDCVVQHKWIT